MIRESGSSLMLPIVERRRMATGRVGESMWIDFVG
jgi:hypothetical protein